jgi:hypothetical protein
MMIFERNQRTPYRRIRVRHFGMTLLQQWSCIVIFTGMRNIFVCEDKLRGILISGLFHSKTWIGETKNPLRLILTVGVLRFRFGVLTICWLKLCLCRCASRGPGFEKPYAIKEELFEFVIFHALHDICLCPSSDDYHHYHRICVTCKNHCRDKDTGMTRGSHCGDCEDGCRLGCSAV